MAKTAIFMADGFEEIEGLTVVDLLRRAGIEISMVSISDSLMVKGSHGIKVQVDKLFKEVNFDELDMIILPGGQPGTTNLDNYEPLKEKIAEFDKAGKYISAICAAPGVFGRMGILKGKKACSYPACEDQLTGADVQKTETTVDGHILTSRGMGTAIAYGLAIVERFQGKEAADKLGENIVYKL
ncbi:MAG: DJ-1/PfpI family protein [Butyrivibrio sp.]|nr:DJ-1/PfpI family protein [Butyrivibrio sp.]